jgi:trk system potassium uptake protein TrkA
VGRSLGFRRVIPRIDEEEFGHIAIELGLETSVVPARAIGRHLADVVEGHEVLELSGVLKGDARAFCFIAGSAEHDVAVGDLEIPDQARIVHLYRNGDCELADPETHLHAGDEVVVLTHRRNLDALRERWLSSPALRDRDPTGTE